MRALVGYRGGIMRLEEVPVPEIREGEVLVRIHASGICGGDYIRKDAVSDNPASRDSASLDPSSAFIPGHEAVGTVVAVGTAVSELVVGDRVAIAPVRACGTCRPCRRGAPQLCSRKPRPTPASGGAFAEHAAVSPRQCYRIPDSQSFIHATLTEPLACCIHAASRVRIDAGDRVAIFGAGPSAQFFAQIARQRGAAATIVFDTIVERLQLAQSLGADVVVNSGDPSDRSKVLEEGADVVIVTRSSPEIMKQAIDVCAPGARLLPFGVSPPGREYSIEANTIWKKELSIIGSRAYGHAFGVALDLIESGHIQVAPLITRIVSLDELLDTLTGGSGGHVKTVVRIAGEE